MAEVVIVSQCIYKYCGLDVAHTECDIGLKQGLQLNLYIVVQSLLHPSQFALTLDQCTEAVTAALNAAFTKGKAMSPNIKHFAIECTTDAANENAEYVVS